MILSNYLGFLLTGVDFLSCLVTGLSRFFTDDLTTALATGDLPAAAVIEEISVLDFSDFVEFSTLLTA